MDIVEIQKDRINEIEPLWCELDSHHLEKSRHFKITFVERSKKLLEMDKLAIFAAKKNAELIEYCIASTNNGVGKIDSLYKATISMCIDRHVAHRIRYVMAIWPKL